MAKVELTNEEGRLIAVYRAITALDQDELISHSDTSDAKALLEEIFDLEAKEKEYSASELKSFILGFIGGLAGARLASSPPILDDSEHFSDELNWPVAPDITISGGPTGGVVAGQGTDENYVAQTGVRKDDE